MTFCIGLDWADREHMVYVQDEAGSEVLQRRVKNTADELGDFGRWLFERVAERTVLKAAIEKPEGRIVDFLLDHGVEVYPINPKSLDRARDRYRMGGSKSDEFDAYVLADYLRTDGERLVPLRPNSPEAAELKMLTRDYHRLVRQQTRLVNQTKATLKEYYPRPLEVLKDVATATFQDFVEGYPTPDALKNLTFSRWRKFAKAHRMGETESRTIGKS